MEIGRVHVRGVVPELLCELCLPLQRDLRAWTSDKHRERVRLLAAQLKALGFDVLIDADVDYGDDLNGFMRRVGDSRRVLLVADRN